ncbi:MAG: 16S rRNA (cytosine(967)-C(5))-methyltransferase RsmB [Tibeticola sp.]
MGAVLAGVRSGRSLTSLLDAVEPGLRAGVQALSFAALRQLGRAQALRRALARRPPPPAADALLCATLALLAEPAPAYTDFTLVDQAVEAAKRDTVTRAQAAFLNACLRRFLREREVLMFATDADPEARWNHPRWWIERLAADHPQHASLILEAAQHAAPMTLRVNRRRVQVGEVLQALAAQGVAAQPVGDDGVLLGRAVPVDALPGFAEGALSVQDAGAQQAAPLLLNDLGATGGRARVLDACAAPGGKTAHLLERADLDLTALDIDPARCERIRDNLRRLGLTARVLAADAARPESWWDGEPFDGILLDAPCTASGIVRRHPDVRWLRREGDVAQLARVQAHLLDTLWPLLRPGGCLVFCTCSVFRAEGSDQAQAFLARHTDARILPAPGHLLPTNGARAGAVPDNAAGDHDGFFYAVFRKALE